MLDVLLIIAAVIVFLGIVLLLWPLRVRFQMWPGRGQIDIRYVLIHVHLNFLTGDSAVRFAGLKIASGIEEKKPKEEAPKEPKEEKEKGPSIRERLQKVGPAEREKGRILWEHRPLLRRVLIHMAKLVGRLIRAWRLDHAKLALVMGLDNPASTGIAAGCIYAALPSLQMSLPRWRIAFVPEFTRAHVAVDADIALRLIPLEPLYQIIRTLGTLPWRGLWKLKAALQQS
ncbi:MAG: DUF2953 domain-containing protein [candidate division Zixibacteria bacterium]|nr:DUF2953 domain-containing protein [candidate division Zixibacteria bacterium]